MTLEADHCITCGDTAVAATGRRASTAPPRPSSSHGEREQVGIELVEPVAVGDVLLCHAGHRARQAAGRAMKFVDEFRSGELAQKLVHELEALVEPGRALKFMEVCGGHTHTIYKHGIEDLVPPEIDFLHGPGCPVCVIPMGRVDDAIALAERPEVIFTTFGDMMRVPGGRGSLLEAKARGADVRMVYSPLDALELARRNPDREVIFFAIGFETTAPSTAITRAARAGRGHPELLGVLQPRDDRAAAQDDPRLARAAARRVHRARSRLDRDRHAARTTSWRATTASRSSSRRSSRSTSCTRP